MLRDGTRYRIVNGYVAWIRDRNGNKLNLDNPGNSFIDLLNRQVTVTGQTGAVEFAYKGFNGATRTIRVWHSNLGNALRPGYSLQTYHDLFPALDGSSYTYFNDEVASSVELPDGRRYWFYYNSYGEVARVVLPTGSAIEHDYAAGVVTGDQTGVVSAPLYDYGIYRRIVERRVYAATGVLESRMTYSRPEQTPFSTLGYVVVDHFAPSGTLLAREKHYYYGIATPAFYQAPTDYPSWDEGKEYQTEWLGADGVTVLRRIIHNWEPGCAVSPWSSTISNNHHIAYTTTTLIDTNQVSKQTFAYDCHNNQTDVYEYDFGTGAPGPLIRRTHTNYVAFNNGADYAGDYNIHIRNPPLQQQVFDAGDVLRAQITYEYDNYNQSNPDVFHAALSECPSISGHDGAFSTGYLPRGNVTKTTRSLLNNSGGVTDSINSYVQYDIAGNVVKAIDPRSTATPLNIIATTFDFSDRFGSPNGESRANTAPPELGGQTSYAFPTKVTDALGQTTYTQYDYYLGRAVDGEDHNGMVSSGFYNDALDRPTQIIRANTASPTDPNRSQTTFIYNDASHLITTTSDRDAFSDNLLKSEIVYDGLGRTVEARTYAPGPAGCSSPCYSLVKTTFDAMSRTYQVSNPYWNHESPIWTTTQYDALSRVTSVTTPDGATVSTATTAPR